jgi:hypothetical protein
MEMLAFKNAQSNPPADSERMSWMSATVVCKRRERERETSRVSVELR